MPDPLDTVSLKALRAFAALAREGGLAPAAARLGISVSNASRLVHGLEDALGRRLLRRDGRGLELTDAGRELADGLVAGFEGIERAVERARTPAPPHGLRLSALPTFTMRWLIPRLGGFERRHPGVPVHVQASLAAADLIAGEADLAVRHGEGDWPGLAARLLLRERLVAVAAPMVAQGRQWTPDAVARELPLLASNQRPDDWPRWFREAGLDAGAVPAQRVLEGQLYVIEAVLAGAGAGLVDEGLIRQELAGGALVRLTDRTVDTGKAYWLVRPAGPPARPEIAAFERWIAEAAAHPPETPSMELRA